jgi:2-methoxy-6-polyprenyl-1,4-benzoquinol methylase
VSETIHCAITQYTNMSSHISRASKRLRVAQQPTTAWMCNSCKRSFASTARSLQTPEQQRKEAEKTTHFGYETVAESLKASKGEATIDIILEDHTNNR